MKTSARLLDASCRLVPCRLRGSKNMHCIVCTLGDDGAALDAAYAVNEFDTLRKRDTQEEAVALLHAAAMFTMSEGS